MTVRRAVLSTAVACVTVLATATAGQGAPPTAAPVRSAPSAGPATLEAPAPDHTRAAPRKKGKKGLRVKVKHPAEAGALVKVTVKGPKQPGKKKRFKKVIKKTKTWKKVRPGVYRIRARTIDLYDQRITPKVVKKKVRIKKSRKRKISTVTYAAPVFCATSGTTAYGWGEGDHGRLGTGDSTDRLTPTAIPRIHGLTAITGGLRSTYGLCGDGTVWSWGFNQNGELGIGKTGDRSWPVQVPGLSGITAIAANRESAYALKADGTVWAWGAGRYGQLGNGSSGFGYLSRTPVQVGLPGAATAIAAGGYNAYAILSSGQVASWGNGGVGQRGDGTAGESTPTPVLVSGITAAERIAAGHATAYVISGPNLLSWGDNGEGEVPTPGDPTPAPNYPVPHVETPGTMMGALGASNSSGYLVSFDAPLGWGSGRHHDTGRSTGGTRAEPGPMSPMPDGSVVAFAGAGYGGYALTGTGQIWAWGDNGAGQVGTGAAPTGPSATEGILPTLIPGLTGVTAIGAGVVNGYAIR